MAADITNDRALGGNLRCSFKRKARPPRVRSSAFTAQVTRRDRLNERISTSKVDAKLGEQTKAPRQPGRSQIASSQIFRRRAWSAGPPGLCWSSRSGSPGASLPLGSRAARTRLLSPLERTQPMGKTSTCCSIVRKGGGASARRSMQQHRGFPLDGTAETAGAHLPLYRRRGGR